MISCLCLWLVYNNRFGTSGFKNKVWFSETTPNNRFNILVEKSENESPLALYASTGIKVIIRDCKKDEVIQSFSTSVEYAGKENYSIEYDDKGVSLLFYDSDKMVDRVFYFSYESLSMIGSNIRGDRDDE